MMQLLSHSCLRSTRSGSENQKLQTDLCSNPPAVQSAAEPPVRPDRGIPAAAPAALNRIAGSWYSSCPGSARHRYPDCCWCCSAPFPNGWWCRCHTHGNSTPSATRNHGKRWRLQNSSAPKCRWMRSWFSTVSARQTRSGFRYPRFPARHCQKTACRSRCWTAKNPSDGTSRRSLASFSGIDRPAEAPMVRPRLS